MKLFSLINCLATFMLGLCSSTLQAHPARVLTSIKPLQMIAQAITEGVSHTEVLVPLGASPHSYNLKPSDAKKIKSVDVFFWVGPPMEIFLTKILGNNPKINAVPLMEIPDIYLRKNGEHHTQEHHHDHHAHHNHQHNHGQYDAHIWLSTYNGKVIAKHMTKVLSSVDRPNAEIYQKNLQIFLQEIEDVDIRNNKKLVVARKRPIFVFHDAYGYLQEQYQLNIDGYFTYSPERQPGPKHLNQLERRIKEVGKTCIFLEPQFQPAYIDRITEVESVKVSQLDPLGENITISRNAFADFINAMVDNISACVLD